MPSTNSLRSNLTLSERRDLARSLSISKLNIVLYSFQPRIANYVSRGRDSTVRNQRDADTIARMSALLEQLSVTSAEIAGLAISASNFQSIIINHVRNEGRADIAIQRADKVLGKLADLWRALPGTSGDTAARDAGVAARTAVGDLYKCTLPKVWDPITETCV